MNRIVILRFDLFGPATVAPPSSTRRTGFYAADMSVEIILEMDGAFFVMPGQKREATRAV